MLDDIFNIFSINFKIIGGIFIILLIIVVLVILYPGKKYNMSYSINEEYLIQKEGIIEGTEVELLSSDFSAKDHERVCFYVDKFTKIGDYYIGHFDGQMDKKRCSRFFYIKKDNTDKKFDVSESEIIEKFGNIEYKYTPDEYINKYGEK